MNAMAALQASLSDLSPSLSLIGQLEPILGSNWLIQIHHSFLKLQGMLGINQPNLSNMLNTNGSVPNINNSISNMSGRRRAVRFMEKQIGRFIKSYFCQPIEAPAHTGDHF